VPRARPSRHTANALPNPGSLTQVHDAIVSCNRCERLRTYCGQIARDKKAAHRADVYWGRPVPGFGDLQARVLVLGLAPAAHGANRTGRVFTGDGSGDFLMRAMHAAGFANIPTSQRADDGLTLTDAYIAAAVRCAPPANKPTPAEQDRCRPYLVRELQLLPDVRVVLPLGSIAWDAALRSLAAMGHPTPRPKPRFGHGAEAGIGPYTLLGSYHPSQQNTFTGRLTQPMLQQVLARARELASLPAA
jgi:uracil-DNA glycosylase